MNSLPTSYVFLALPLFLWLLYALVCVWLVFGTLNRILRPPFNRPPPSTNPFEGEF